MIFFIQNQSSQCALEHNQKKESHSCSNMCTYTHTAIPYFFFFLTLFLSLSNIVTSFISLGNMKAPFSVRHNVTLIPTSFDQVEDLLKYSVKKLLHLLPSRHFLPQRPDPVQTEGTVSAAFRKNATRHTENTQESANNTLYDNDPS